MREVDWSFSLYQMYWTIWVRIIQKIFAFNVENAGIEDTEARETVRNLVLYPDENIKNQGLPDLRVCHKQSLSIFIVTAVIVAVIFAILCFLLFRFSSLIIQ